MADNITLYQGSGGDTLAADEISGAKYQRVKLIHGADGSNDGDVANTNPFPVSMAQVADANNTKTVAAADAQPGNPWVGTWTATRSVGVVRQLIVLSCANSAVGGTFTFEYSEDGISATISESRVIDDFTTVRDFDLLNSGAYFRVKFEPASPLAGDTVVITTTNRRQYDGPFVRLGNQEIEEQNAALGSMFSYVKGFNHFTGKSSNIRVDSYIPDTVTSTPLGAGGSFDSGIASCEPYNYVVTEIYSDQSGTLTVSFYDDAVGSNLLRTFQRPYTAGEGFAIAGSILTRPYVRYQYTNGVTPQGVFHLATKVLNQSLNGQILGLSDFVPTNIITSVNRSMLMGFNPSGAVKNVALNSANALMSANFLTEVAKGAVAGHSVVHLSGQNPDIDSAATETIWGAASAAAPVAIYSPPTASTVMNFTVNAADTGLGLSAIIRGLDASGNAQTETLALNSTSKNSVSTYSAMEKVELSGATAPANDILIQINSTTVGLIIAGDNVTQNGYYHVPTGKTAYLTSLFTASSNNSASSRTAYLRARKPGSSLFQTIGSFGGHSQGGPTVLTLQAAQAFAAGTVIRIDMAVGANNNQASVDADFLLVDD